MIIYSVTVTLQADIESVWRQWMLEKHIPDVMKTGCFMSYQMAKVKEAEGELPVYRIDYKSVNMTVFERYLNEHAPALRQDAMSRFEGKFTATRNVLELTS